MDFLQLFPLQRSATEEVANASIISNSLTESRPPGSVTCVLQALSVPRCVLTATQYFLSFPPILAQLAQVAPPLVAQQTAPLPQLLDSASGRPERHPAIFLNQT